MVQERGMTTTRSPQELAARSGPPEALTVSTGYVAQTLSSIHNLQDMTAKLLVRGRDYGRTPGTQSDGLWDPGASLIIAGFNCYAGQRRILSLVDEDNKISVIVEVPLVSRQSGLEVGSGIGAASTLEAKHSSLWKTEEEMINDYGYTKEEIATLKAEKKLRTNKNHIGKWRMENPDRGGLLNTLVKQASKRAEVDAAEALPGVSSVLRTMFDPDKPRGGDSGGKPKYEGAKWQRFWGDANRLG
ncbi:MAG: hypothetical protein V2A77_01060, partial [Pseudomonadota bacterium]